MADGQSGATQFEGVATRELFAQKIFVPNGSASVPALFFANDQDTGFFLSSDGVMGITTAGSVKLLISASGLSTSYPHTTNGLTRVSSSQTLADDGTITLTSGVGGYLQVWTDTVWMTVHVSNTGTISEAGNNSIDSDIADTDTKLCVYDGGTGAVIKNRLGSSQTIRYVFTYS